MTPIEQAIRAACRTMGGDPDTWHGFENIGRAAINAFVNALPDDLARAIRDHLNHQGDSHA